jgi:hypothetical protein
MAPMTFTELRASAGIGRDLIGGIIADLVEQGRVIESEGRSGKAKTRMFRTADGVI